MNKHILEKTTNEKVPKKLQARYEEITAIIDSVCQEYLNGEYADMSCKIAAAPGAQTPLAIAKWARQHLGVRHRLHDRVREFPLR